MNQFVIDMTSSQPGLRSSHPAAGDLKVSVTARGGPVRTTWPFLVNASAAGDKQAPKEDPFSQPGFAS